jgi:hypothetical protein
MRERVTNGQTCMELKRFAKCLCMQTLSRNGLTSASIRAHSFTVRVGSKVKSDVIFRFVTKCQISRDCKSSKRKDKKQISNLANPQLSHDKKRNEKTSPNMISIQVNSHKRVTKNNHNYHKPQPSNISELATS